MHSGERAAMHTRSGEASPSTFSKISGPINLISDPLLSPWDCPSNLLPRKSLFEGRSPALEGRELYDMGFPVVEALDSSLVAGAGREGRT